MTEKAEPARTPQGLLAISIFSLVGLAANVYLTTHFYAVRGGTAGFKSACNLSSAMNCDVVAASPWAELVAGLPLSSFGAGWFLALFVLSILARSGEWRREGDRLLLGFTATGAIFSAWYIFVMAALIKTYCLFCLVVDVASFGALAAAFTLRPPSLAKHPLEAGIWRTGAIVTAICVGVALVFMKSLDEGALPRNQVDERVDSVLSSPVLAVAAGAEYATMGPKDAPITVVEFSDFQCPFCRIGALNLNTVLNRYPGKIRVVFRNYPLDSSCNKNMEHSMHQYACEAARLAWCANRQGKFAPVYENFFDKQASFGVGEAGSPEKMAQEAGANLEQLHACASGTDPGMAIAKDIEEGKQLGVQSTPTFFINGHKIEGAYPVPVWVAIVDRLLPGSR